MAMIYVWILLGMGQANERRRYIVSSPLIGGAHIQDEKCLWHHTVPRGHTSVMKSQSTVHSTEYLFNSLYTLTAKETSKLQITSLL